jgi:outer membrane receptor protein involved in Fe transport
MGDLQLKYIRWEFDQERMGAFPGHVFDLDWLFLSPRVGLNYSFDSSSNAYVNLAISSREPNDVDIYDANDPGKFPQLDTLRPATAGRYTFGDPTVEPERVIDLELGIQTSQQHYQLGLNAFWMRFENENVFEAGVDVLDRPITINIDESVHAGVEFAGAVKPHEKLTVSGNLSVNRNRVTDYDSTYFYSVDTTTANESIVVDFEGKTTPGFPEYLGNLIFDYQSPWYRLTYRIRAVGKQYMDMFNSEDHAIDDFVTSSLSASLTWRDFMSIGHLTVTGRVYNLFNKKYVASGYGGNYVTRVVNEPPMVNTWAEYYVGPERSVYGEVTLDLF